MQCKGMKWDALRRVGGVAVTGRRVRCRLPISSAPGRGGMIWPSSEFSVTSSSRLRWAEVKVRARIEAVSDRITAVSRRSSLES